MSELNKLILYLSYSFQHPDSYEVGRTQVGSHWGEQCENYSAQDSEAKQPLGSIAACQVAPRNLCQDVAIEEGAQYPALCLRVPVVHTGLCRSGLRTISGIKPDYIYRIPFVYLCTCVLVFNSQSVRLRFLFTFMFLLIQLSLLESLHIHHFHEV